MLKYPCCEQRVKAPIFFLAVLYLQYISLYEVLFPTILSTQGSALHGIPSLTDADTTHGKGQYLVAVGLLCTHTDWLLQQKWDS